jgi:pimeloyl-ACP methyl ester carboxylesterase
MSGLSSDHPVLLLHSSGLGAGQWARVQAGLPGAVAPDLGGYGGVPWRGMPGFSWRDDLAVAEAALDTLGDAHVVGHSYGGFLALQLARRRPVRSVVAWEPVAFGLLGQRAIDEQASFLDRSAGLEAWLAGFLAFWNGPGAWERMSARRRAPFLEHGEKVHAEVRRLAEDRTTLAQWGEIGAPALILAGAETKPEAAQVCAMIAGAIPGGRHELVRGAGHMGPVTHAPELVERLRRWFDEGGR